MKSIISFTLIIVVILFSGCREYPIEIPPPKEVISNRVVLIEELTGVSCPNCPAGAEKVEALLFDYPDNVVAVAVHGKFLSKPLDVSTYDFRNQEAEDLENSFKPWLGKPAAAINRVHFPDYDFQAVDDVDLWRSYVEQELEKDNELVLELSQNFDESTRELVITAKATPVITESGNYRIGVVITEGDIVDAQLDQGMILPAYVHNHVFRTMLTDIEGDPFTTSWTQNEPIEQQFTFTVPTSEDGLWNTNHLEVVAFISRVDGDRNEVMQAAKVKVEG